MDLNRPGSDLAFGVPEGSGCPIDNVVRIHLPTYTVECLLARTRRENYAAGPGSRCCQSPRKEPRFQPPRLQASWENLKRQVDDVDVGTPSWKMSLNRWGSRSPDRTSSSNPISFGMNPGII
jgi:hypothetical protein